MFIINILITLIKITLQNKNIIELTIVHIIKTNKEITLLMLELQEEHLYKEEEITLNMFHKIKKVKKLQFENELFLLIK